jgi:hypothetical protein
MEPSLRALRDFGLDKIIESFAPTFLHALEAEAEIHRDFDAERLVCVQDVEPSQYWAFIVARTPADQTASVFVNDKREGIGVPAIALLRLRCR